MNPGLISTVKDLIVHVTFDANMPNVGEVLVVQNKQRSPLLVDSLLDESTAVCINIRSNKDIQKKMPVIRTNRGIEIPVGPETIGRIFNPLGEVVDGQTPLPANIKKKNIF